MRLWTYAGFSFLGAITCIYHAFNSREHFYPAMVYLSTSKICLVLLLNTVLVMMCILWQLAKRLFLGSLREAEVERLNEQSWREVMEILFAVTIFRQDFSVNFLVMVTALLLIKALHWLAQKRVEYIETTPTVSRLSHIRIVSFMGFLFVLDSLFLYSSVKPLIQTWQASVALFFSFEYMILVTTTVSTFVRYVFYVRDMLMEGQWEKKAVYTFYLELVRDLLHLSMYLFFFLVIFMNYGLPLHLIRELYETFRNFKIRIADYIRYRKITSNMNERFPDATDAELNASDATCIICREEMVSAKKLICGHLFHVHCLRSWLERQQTCPTCRSLVVPSETALGRLGRQHGMASVPHQHGSGVTETSARNPGDAIAGNNLSPHQFRLQAAANAASIYQKSFVYLPTNPPANSPGNPFVPHFNDSAREAYNGKNTESSENSSISGQLQQHQSPSPSAYRHLAYLQVPHYVFLPSQAHFNVQSPSLEAQEALIRSHIEVLQAQLQLLQQNANIFKSGVENADPPMADCKGKAAISISKSVASTSESGFHREIVDGGT